jgi:hypothetical protein
LDRKLVGADPNVRIRFELDLFRAFNDRGWMTLKSFGPLEFPFSATKLPAHGMHLAIPTWDLPENGYQVGPAEPRSAAKLLSEDEARRMAANFDGDKSLDGRKNFADVTVITDAAWP